ncbi:PQQ-dependent sugar dehydrogenase [Cohnella lupini]|uniref:Glucose/arabinose dehydrogenase n=1 Tax=Cohnella lupini TaxID=1294267 RepID=A0A3D9IT92_9BACL|nr:PQQ-dependent sugar dehydrogenase [Cohnella lupini]RED64729.1 glucose/arabinose dehydrogenase [Cohnella lupini]
MRKIGGVLAGLLLLLGLTACWGSNEPAATDGGSKETADEIEGITFENPFGTESFDNPVGLEHRAGYEDLLYIIEQPGRIISKNLARSSDEPEVILDITDRVYDEGGEQGLLGLAFHPNDSDRAYVNYTTETHTIIARYDTLSDDPERLDPGSEHVLLSFEQPFPNHNGGQLAFGPDGFLYIATGDGGGGGDPRNNSQNLESLLGKILRIDVDRQTEGKGYSIPEDNPFIEKGRPEIYAYGMRNPWRFSFDPEDGKLWAADVGQNRYEEINLIEKGGNYGWRIQEGTECYKPSSGCDSSGLEQPIFTYGRDQGVSITGGYVYRGKALPELAGWYVYADYGMGTLWALRQREDGTIENRTLLQPEENITSFGRDAEGELYVCTQGGQIFRII